MREMLEPVFGEGGAVMAQFIITLVVILALIALVYWLVGRVSGMRLHSAGRGRPPRLAILDALSVDGRRKLVLVRRDNVEHLLLIGGPSDVVVEPSIVRSAPAAARPQRPNPTPPMVQAQPQAPAQPPMPAPPRQSPPPPTPPSSQPTAPTARQRRPDNGVSEPIPFPQAQRTPQARTAPLAAEPAAGAEPSSSPTAPVSASRRRPLRGPLTAATTAASQATAMPASGRFEETAKPARVESVVSLADTLDDITREPAETGRDFAGAARPAPQPVAASTAEATSEKKEELPSASSDRPASPAIAATGETANETEAGDSSDAKVSDLEKEMARLLGEITSPRGDG